MVCGPIHPLLAEYILLLLLYILLHHFKELISSHFGLLLLSSLIVLVFVDAVLHFQPVGDDLHLLLAASQFSFLQLSSNSLLEIPLLLEDTFRFFFLPLHVLQLFDSVEEVPELLFTASIENSLLAELCDR